MRGRSDRVPGLMDVKERSIERRTTQKKVQLFHSYGDRPCGDTRIAMPHNGSLAKLRQQPNQEQAACLVRP